MQLALARLLGLKQPRVLDGDDGLVGEGLHQLNVPGRERFDMLPEKRKHADDRAIAQQRHSEIGAYFPDGGGLRQSVFVISCDVSNVYDITS